MTTAMLTRTVTLRQSQTQTDILLVQIDGITKRPIN